MKIIILIVGVLLLSQVHSQSCYPGFDYRQEITITSSASNVNYTDFQVRVNVNTQALVSAGKAKFNGDDFRFKDAVGNVLSYWFDPATYNQVNTTFWVEVPSVPQGTSTIIYMYYGNPLAGAVSSGVATFELFDTFDDVGIDITKWDKFGINTNFNVNGGNCVFSHANPDTMALLVSTATFTDTLIAEVNTISASNGIAIIGLVDGTNTGYGTAFENNNMRLMGVTGASPVISNLSVTNVPITNPSGIWSFSWPTGASQNVAIQTPTASQAYTDNTHLTSFALSKRIILGVEQGLTGGSLGDIQVSWVRARKYSVVEPTATFSGSEEEYPNTVNLSSTGPYCSGEAIFISSNDFAGATYVWKKDNVIQANIDSSISIVTGVVADQGVYSVDISMPGCVAVNETISIAVAAPSIEGTITPIGVLCSGNNLDSLVLTGQNGSILRWEMSNSVIGPWTPLADTTPSLPFQNLVSSTYYRTVVKSGTCPEVTQSSPYEVVVDSITQGGFLIGATSACSGGNGGIVNLVYENGSVLWWESSTDNFTTINNITNTNTSYTYNNLTQTTQYRALVKSGVCPSYFSSEVEIIINANPVPAFTSTVECQGFTTVFDNSTSTSTDGAIVNYSWDFGNGNGSISNNPSYVYPAAGSYNVSLTIESDRGCTGSITQGVLVNPLPVVDFDQNSVCLGAPMSFVVTSIPIASVLTYDWDFGDGTTDVVPSPSHNYLTSGTYNVQLIIESTLLCTDSITIPVTVNEPVDVSFLCDSVCLGNQSTFINTSVSPSSTVQYTWFFGDGSVSPLTNPIYTYASTGTYVVSLEAVIGSAPSTCTRTITDTVVIYEVPSTSFNFTNVCQLDSATFQSTSTFSGGTSTLNYLWDFGDASSSSLDTVNHKYTLPNTYNVGLTTTSQDGCSSSLNQLVSIYYMPTSGFSFTDVCLGNQMAFASSSNITSGTISFEWDFGDTTSSTLENPAHMYAFDNAYSVELIVTSDNGCKDTTIQMINVNPLPIMGYIADAVCDGITTVFTDTTSIASPGFINSYVWDFGDGSSSTSTNPTHLFLNVGTYSVKLQAYSDKGCFAEITQPVIVNAVPVPNFQADEACVGSTTLFDNQTLPLPGIPTFSWNFDDGGTSTLTDPTYVYQSAGFYQVTLVTTSAEGCVDSIKKNVEAFELPIINAGIDTSVSQGFSVGLDAFYPGAIGYNWTPSEGLDNNSIFNPNATPFQTTVYSVIITDINGCKGQDSVVVSVEEDFKLFVHNVITPDGNGINDFWKITNIETFGEANVFIYDRWGVEVYSKKGYQNDWAGTSGNDQLPDGTYYYIIQVSGIEKVYKGSLTILRNK